MKVKNNVQYRLNTDPTYIETVYGGEIYCEGYGTFYFRLIENSNYAKKRIAWEGETPEFYGLDINEIEAHILNL